MKIRQKLLLEELLRGEPMGVPQIAEEFSVSVKTIRNDLAELDEFLATKLASSCLLIENNEVCVTGDSDARSTARSNLRLDDLYLYKLTPNERAVLILMELLSGEEYVTIAALSDQLFVSRGTINTDLHIVKGWCASNKVQIQFKKSRGIIINENERRRRELFARLVQDFKFIDGLESQDLTGGLYARLFEGVNMSAIKDVILDAEQKFDFELSDVAYEGLVVHIALSILRDRNREQIGQENIPSPPKNSVQYRMAEFIAGQLNEQLEAELGDTSIGYISLHIFGRGGEHQPYSANERLPYVQVIAEKLVQGVSRSLSFDFRVDNKLYDGLMLHLCEAITRMKNHLSMTNPIKETIIAEYRHIYEAVVAESVPLTHFTGYEPTSDEIAYIVIHFASAMEREKRLSNSHTKPAVLIVCGTGDGTARLVQDQVSRHFSFNIMGAVSSHRLAAMPERALADFIISTVPLETDKPVVLVGPILRENALTAINKMVISLGFNNFWIPEMTPCVGGLTSMVQRTLECYYKAEDEPRLLAELRELVNNYEASSKLSKKERRYMLSEVLRTEYIALNQNAEDWRQAVRLGGGQLVKNGVVEQEYVQAAIQNVIDLGPYIVLTKGVAVPHASAEFGVHQTAISLVSLREPVCFGSPDNDPVKYIFTLATTDSKSHLNALRDLVSLFDNRAFFDTINDAENPQEVTAFIKAFERGKEGKQ